MEFQFAPELESFRTDVRTFIAANWEPPPASVHAGDAVSFAADRAYERKLAERGWLTLAWPKEYGGLGASHMQQRQRRWSKEAWLQLLRRGRTRRPVSERGKD